MTTDWLDGALAHTFGGLDGLTERTVGYPALFRELGLGGPGVSTLLDYGCGPGWIALEIAERYDVEITAVDIAPEMLRLARARPHPRVRHRLLDASGLDFLAPSSIDAAMCCFVFSNVAELTELRRITDAGVRGVRALRPRATLAQAERIRAVTRAATVAESTLAPLLLIVAER